MKKRKLNWNDLKMIVEFKTFLLVVSLAVLGVVCLLLEYFIFRHRPDSVFSGMFSEIGIAFITSSTVSLLMEIFLRIDIVDFMTERMLNALPESIQGNTGVSEFYKDRKRIDFKHLIEESKDFLYIIGVSSNDILASANMPVLKKKILENPNFKVQILLLSPWSFTAYTRASAPIYKTSYEGILKTQAVIMDICNLLESIKECDENITDRLELRLYDDIPSLSMIIDSDNAIVAPFMVIEQGGSSPYFIAKKLDPNSGIYDVYCGHFSAIWNNAIKVDSTSSFESLYSNQKAKDAKRANEVPENFTNWILTINNAK